MRQPVYYITTHQACQYLFETFFEFFPYRLACAVTLFSEGFMSIPPSLPFVNHILSNSIFCAYDGTFDASYLYEVHI